MIGYLQADYPLIHAFQAAPVRRTRREALAAGRIFRTAPKLADFLPREELAAVEGSLDRPISGLATDGRRVVPGTVYFALPGGNVDGAAGIAAALNRGAVAVVTDKMPMVPPGKATFVEVADVRATLARVAQRYYKFPDRDLTAVAVTGAAGKTSVAHLLKHFLQGDQRAGLLGSVQYDLGARTVPSFETTPEALDVFGMLAQMRDAGCRHAVVEVSADGLAQQRVRGVQFGAAIWTNLAAGRADSASSETEPLVRQLPLFTGVNGAVPKVSVINLDDPRGAELADYLRIHVPATRVLTFGETAAADVRAERVTTGPKSTAFRLVWPAGAMDLDAPLVGRASIGNLLAAIAAALGLGRDPVVFLARLRACPAVPGRLERVDEGQSFNVIVDAARSPAALRHALATLRPVTVGRLLLVYGCEGQRDRGQRADVARVAEEGADLVIATADNPRTERLEQIFADMRAGAGAKQLWVADRRRAISLALELARPGDCVLLAGKGHDGVQEIAGTVFPCDDRQVARELLARRRPQA